jgi:hypothetical protein
MHEDEIRRVLDDPIARELLQSPIARLAYSAPDGSPRVIPIGFETDGDRIVMYSEPSAPKYKGLAADPRVALTIDTFGPPQRVLLVRGVAAVDVDPSHIEGYLGMSRVHVNPDSWSGFEAGVRGLYRTMGRIAVTPQWVKILDFEQRMPEFLERLARERGL